MHDLSRHAEGAVRHAQAEGGHGRGRSKGQQEAMSVRRGIQHSRRVILTSGAVLLAALAVPAAAQNNPNRDYPSRQIKVIVPFAAAGVQDMVSRVVFEKVTAALGQTAVIENRPGAGGTLGLTAAAQSAPDGYTLVVGDPLGSLAVARSLYARLPYDPLTSFVPVALVGQPEQVTEILTGKIAQWRTVIREAGI